MTGGQYSPLTPVNHLATTAPYRTVERPFDIPELAKAAGATFVARGTAFHTPMLVDLITQAIRHDGFALVEAVTQCPVYNGRQNKLGDAANMLRWQKENAVTVESAKKLTPEQLAGKFLIGVLHKADAPEYTRQYDAILARAQKGAK